MNKLPKARSKNVVVQTLRDEVLIYDLANDKAYCLNDTSAKVFNACDGIMTFAELKAEHKLTDDIIYLALDSLKKQNLLEDDYVSPFAGMSRREVIKKIGLASMVTLPVISGLVAPQASQAASQGTSGGNGCSPYIGVCLAPGNKGCQGCAGRIIFATPYASTDGSCTGAGINYSYRCPPNGNPATNAPDVKINSTT